MKKYIEQLNFIKVQIEKVNDSMKHIINLIRSEKSDAKVRELLDEYKDLEKLLFTLKQQCLDTEKRMQEDLHLIPISVNSISENDKNVEDKETPLSLLGDPETGEVIPVNLFIPQKPIEMDEFEGHCLQYRKTSTVKNNNKKK